MTQPVQALLGPEGEWGICCVVSVYLAELKIVHSVVCVWRSELTEARKVAGLPPNPTLSVLCVSSVYTVMCVWEGGHVRNGVH